MIRDFRRTPPEELTYWEVTFRRRFRSRCIDELRKFLRKVDEESTSIQAMIGEEPEVEGAFLDPVDQATRREIMSILTRDEAVAVELAWFQRMQVSGGDGTVVGLMGKSRRTVYNCLASARAKIIADPRSPSWLGRA
jgi:predicted DNA-binding protein (UPF0251 family)